MRLLTCASKASLLSAISFFVHAALVPSYKCRGMRRRGGGVQYTCSSAAELQCLPACLLGSEEDRVSVSKRVKNARSAGKLLRERVLQAKKTEICAQNRT